MLILNDIHSYYDKSHILMGVSLEVREGELITLLGRNGAGKSTTLKSITGIVRPRQGEIHFMGKLLNGLEPYLIARQGICLVPENRAVFSILSVEENLNIAWKKGSRWSISDVYRLFPRLQERRKNGGGNLSGGEQQMLAIARALVNNPRILLLDEPTEGLAPVIVQEIVSIMREIKKSGIPIILVEQNISVCEKIADRHYILEQGQMVYSGTQNEFAGNDAVKDRYLSLKTV